MIALAIGVALVFAVVSVAVVSGWLSGLHH